MGLAEKKRVKVLQEEFLAPASEKINAALGKSVEINVDWEDAMAKDDDASGWILKLAENTFRDLADHLVKMCEDDMSKEALAESIDSISFSDLAYEHASEQEIKIDGKVMKINWLGGNGDWLKSNTLDSIEGLL